MALTAAYKKLHIDDPTILDEQIVVAYYEACGSPQKDRDESLAMIAEARNSRWLRMIVANPGCLTNEMVAILNNKPQESSAIADHVIGPPAPHGVEPILPAIEACISREKANDRDSDTDTSDVDSLSSQSAYAPSSSEEYASDSIVDADFNEFQDEEAYFDWDDETDEGGVWNCSRGEQLIDGKCPEGHCGFCKNCGWEIVADCPHCPKTCQRCGQHKAHGVCTECGPEEEESKKTKETIVFDKEEGIWRCNECQWEIEADNETDGNCHRRDTGERRMKKVDLSRYPEYEPADLESDATSSSSTESSEDEEVDSDEEDSIDDGENVMEIKRFGNVVRSVEAEEAAEGGVTTDSDTAFERSALTPPSPSEPDGCEL